MGAPFVPVIVTMDGTWMGVVLSDKWTEVNIQARTAANLSISNRADGSNYRTIKSGKSLSLGADFGGETLYIQGAVGVKVEILTQTRP